MNPTYQAGLRRTRAPLLYGIIHIQRTSQSLVRRVFECDDSNCIEAATAAARTSERVITGLQTCFFFPGAYRSDKRKMDPKRECRRHWHIRSSEKASAQRTPKLHGRASKIAFTRFRNVKRCFSRLKVVNFATKVYFCGAGFRLRT